MPTRYEVRGGRLVQHVDHAGADYPVVADPTVSFGWYIYIRHSKAEVQNLRWAVEFNADYGPLVCGIIPNAAAVSACIIVVSLQWSSIWDTWINAANRNQCFEFRMIYTPRRSSAGAATPAEVAPGRPAPAQGAAGRLPRAGGLTGGQA